MHGGLCVATDPHSLIAAVTQESKRSFITFHDDKPLEPLVPVKWEDFNIKVNTTIPEILQWVKHINIVIVECMLVWGWMTARLQQWALEKLCNMDDPTTVKPPMKGPPR